MFGAFVLGGLATLGLLKVLHWRRHARWAWGGCGAHRRWHGAWRDGAGDPYGPDFGTDRHAHTGFRYRHVLGFLSSRLDLSPAQERTVGAAVEEFQAEMKGLRGEGRRTRDDLAAALRKPVFDEVLMGELYARHDEALEKARKAFVGLTAKVHEALDERQRTRLAELVERGPRFGRGFGW